MKVNYPTKDAVNIKEVKEALKPFGGRCAKIIDGKLEYQIKEENESAAFAEMKNKGFIE